MSQYAALRGTARDANQQQPIHGLLLTLGCTDGRRFVALDTATCTVAGNFVFNVDLATAGQHFEIRATDSSGRSLAIQSGEFRFTSSHIPKRILLEIETYQADKEEEPPGRVAGDFSVRGRVTHPDGTPLAAVTVAACHRKVDGTFESRGTATTGTDGSYSIGYTDGTMRLVVLVGADIGSSAVYNRPERHQIAHITIDDDAYRRTDEYTRLNTATSGLLDGELTWADVDDEGLKSLAIEVGFSLESVTAFRDAQVLATALTVSVTRANPTRTVLTEPAVTYALLRQGAPADADRIIGAPVARSKAAIIAVAEANQIAASFGDPANDYRTAEDLAFALSTLVVQRSLDGEGPDPLGPVLDTIDILVVTAQDKRDFVEDLYAHRGPMDQFWDDFAIEHPSIDVATLRRTHEMGDFTMRNVKMVKAIDLEYPGTTIKDIASFTETQWGTVLDNSTESPDIPDGFTGTAAERREQYIEYMRRAGEKKYPHAVVRQRVRDDLNALSSRTSDEQGLLDFLDDAPDHNFRAQVTSEMYDEDVGLRDNLCSLRRQYRISPETDRIVVMRALQAKGYTSVSEIKRAGKRQFMADMAAFGLLQALAVAVFRMALAWSAFLNWLMLLMQKGRERPDWPELVQVVDFSHCDCKHCRSILSPAAYLVDILEFVFELGAATELNSRRPDIGELLLSCANTNTPLPHIDLVLEILEDAVHPPVPAIVHDTGNATAEQLLANPQYVNVEAYNDIKDAVHPLSAPFQFFNVQADVFLPHQGISRPHLMEVFQKDNDPGLEPTNTEIAGARLGLSPRAVEALTMPGGTSLNSWELWGLSNAVDLEALATAVPEFRRLADLSKSEIHDIMAAEFWNPASTFTLSPAGVCDPDECNIAGGPTASDFQRLMQFLRARNALSWTWLELDKAIQSLGHTSLDADEFVALESVSRLLDATGASVLTALSWWSNIDTRQDRDMVEEPALSLYDELFLANDTVAALYSDGAPESEVFALNDNRDELATLGETMEDHIAALRAAFSVDETQLLAAMGDVGENLSLNMKNLSAVYRRISLASGLDMPVTQMLATRDLQWHEPLLSRGYIGCLTTDEANLVTTPGACVVISDEEPEPETLLGSLNVVNGDVVEFDGADWVLLAASVNGFPPAGVRLGVHDGAVALSGPLVEGSDECKLAVFLGGSMTAALNTAAVDEFVRVIAGVDAGTYFQKTATSWIRWHDSVVSRGYLGNLSQTDIATLTPVAGDCVVVTSPGGIFAAGDIGEYDGSRWRLLVQNHDGKVPAGTRLLVHGETVTLWLPLVDGADEGRIAVFDGISNDPMLTAGTGVARITVAAGVDVGSAFQLATGPAWIATAANERDPFTNPSATLAFVQWLSELQASALGIDATRFLSHRYDGISVEQGPVDTWVQSTLGALRDALRPALEVQEKIDGTGELLSTLLVDDLSATDPVAVEALIDHLSPRMVGLHKVAADSARIQTPSDNDFASASAGFTVCARVNFDSVVGDPVIMSVLNDDDPANATLGWALRLSGGNLEMGYISPTGEVTLTHTATTMAAGTWYWIFAQVDDTGECIVGIDTASTTSTTSRVLAPVGEDEVGQPTLMSPVDGGADHAQMTITDLRVYKRALGSVDRDAIRTGGGEDGIVDGLITHLPFKAATPGVDASDTAPRDAYRAWTATAVGNVYTLLPTIADVAEPPATDPPFDILDPYIDAANRTAFYDAEPRTPTERYSDLVKQLEEHIARQAAVPMVLQHLSLASGLGEITLERLRATTFDSFTHAYWWGEPVTDTALFNPTLTDWIGVFYRREFLDGDAGEWDDLLPDPNGEPSHIKNAVDVLALLCRVGQIATSHQVTHEELVWWLDITGNPVFLRVLDLKTIYGTTHIPPQTWLQVARLFAFRDGLSGNEPSFAEIMSHLLGGDVDTFLDALQARAGWPLGEEILQLDDDFKVEMDADWLLRFADCVRIASCLGVSVNVAATYREADLTAAQADDVVDSARAKYANVQDWYEVARPLRDELRVQQRDALVDWLVKDLCLEDADGLHDLFLVDTQVSPCALTSRVKQATGSVQLFMQRMLLGLEGSIQPDEEQREQWDWQRSYRVWEAARRVFLYPENWIEPELRQDASHLFENLDDKLTSGPMTDDRTTEAMIGYIEDLDSVANLEVMSTCTNDDDGVSHILGRTGGQPYKYFYRWTNGDTWSAWEPIDVNIEGDHPLISLHEGILRVFWLVVEPTDPGQAHCHPWVAERQSSSWSEPIGGEHYQRFVINGAPVSARWWIAKQDSGSIQLELGAKFAPVNVLFNYSIAGRSFSHLWTGARPWIGDALVLGSGIVPNYNRLIPGGDLIMAWDGVQPRDLLETDGALAYSSIDATGFDRDAFVRPFVASLASTTWLVRLEDWGYFTFSNLSHPLASELLHTVRLTGLGSLAEEYGRQNQDDDGAFDDLVHIPSFVSTSPRPETTFNFNLNDANGIYNWELFFHAPFAIASSLNQDRRFDEAQRWYHKIFNPMNRDTMPAGLEDYQRWLVKPFLSAPSAPVTDWADFTGASDAASQAAQNFSAQVAAWMRDPFDPHLLARMRPSAYQNAIVMKYVENLIDWADDLFRRDSLEALNEATQLYLLAYDVLGERPETAPERLETLPMSYLQLRADLDGLNNPKVAIEDFIDGDLPFVIDWGNNLPDMAPTFYFCIPENERILELWSTIDDRVFKIRNCLDIEGTRRDLPLFEPRIDPALLVRASAYGVDLSSVLSDIRMPRPHYRFQSMAGRSQALLASVRALGGALLQAIEKRDGEELAMLRAGLEIELLNQVRTTKVLQKESAESGLLATEASLDEAKARRKYYKKLLDGEGPFARSKKERQQATLLETQRIAAAAGAAAFTLGAFKKSDSGQIPDALIAAGHAAGGLAGWWGSRAHIVGNAAAHERRRTEWEHQKDQAKLQIATLKQQIEGALLAVDLADEAIKDHDTQVANQIAIADFMRDKYSSQELYKWMVKEISNVYFQSYQLAETYAKKAQKCYQTELGLPEASFVLPGHWDGLHEGLLAGERLQREVEAMEAAYLDNDLREYEITKHVSLELTQPEALIVLRDTGSASFTLQRALFDLDFPSHYFRRIKGVSITIPGVAGPYVNINCKLSCTQSATHRSTAVADAEEDSQLSESIVTSGAVDDSGLFRFDFTDPRYLPFERRGVESSWNIEFTSALKQFDWNSIRDVILTIRYTAREGGSEYGSSTTAALENTLTDAEGSEIAFSVASAFGDAWFAMWTDAVGPVLEIPLTSAHFPFVHETAGVKINSVQMYPIGGDFSATLATSGVKMAWGSDTLVEPSAVSVKSIQGWGLSGLDQLVDTFTLTIDPSNADDRLVIQASSELDPEAVQDIIFVIKYKVGA